MLSTDAEDCASPPLPSGLRGQRSRIRPATVADIPAVLRLIAPGVAAGRVLPRTPRAIATTLRDVLLVERGGQMVGVGWAGLIEDGLAEVKALEAPLQADRDLLLTHLLDGLVEMGAASVLMMTDAPDAFVPHGFVPTQAQQHPSKWQGQCLRCPRQPMCCLEAMQKSLGPVLH